MHKNVMLSNKSDSAHYYTNRVIFLLDRDKVLVLTYFFTKRLARTTLYVFVYNKSNSDQNWKFQIARLPLKWKQSKSFQLNDSHFVYMW